MKFFMAFGILCGALAGIAGSLLAGAEFGIALRDTALCAAGGMALMKFLRWVLVRSLRELAREHRGMNGSTPTP